MNRIDTEVESKWSGFYSRLRRRMWVEFVGSLFCCERLFPGYSKFLVLPLVKNKNDLTKVDLIATVQVI